MAREASADPIDRALVEHLGLFEDDAGRLIEHPAIIARPAAEALLMLAHEERDRLVKFGAHRLKPPAMDERTRPKIEEEREVDEAVDAEPEPSAKESRERLVDEAFALTDKILGPCDERFLDAEGDIDRDGEEDEHDKARPP